MNESASQEEPKPTEENGKEDKERKQEETETKDPIKSSKSTLDISASGTCSNVAEAAANKTKSQEYPR